MIIITRIGSSADTIERRASYRAMVNRAGSLVSKITRVGSYLTTIARRGVDSGDN